ncbi:MAG TPA: hypothetical protein VGW78_00505 [Candidatus Babeliales bacterium]|nr:hypothetical protein [Candidatus Babeliales bacterium]
MKSARILISISLFAINASAMQPIWKRCTITLPDIEKASNESNIIVDPVVADFAREANKNMNIILKPYILCEKNRLAKWSRYNCDITLFSWIVKESYANMCGKGSTKTFDERVNGFIDLSTTIITKGPKALYSVIAKKNIEPTMQEIQEYKNQYGLNIRKQFIDVQPYMQKQVEIIQQSNTPKEIKKQMMEYVPVNENRKLQGGAHLRYDASDEDRIYISKKELLTILMASTFDSQHQYPMVKSPIIGDQNNTIALPASIYETVWKRDNIQLTKNHAEL